MATSSQTVEFPKKTGRSCEGADSSWLSSKVSRTLAPLPQTVNFKGREAMFKIEVFNALQMRMALQNIPLSKQPFKTQLQIENEDVI
jgi:hypothetical protein